MFFKQVFFPIVFHDRYYVIVYNMKYAEIHILDSRFTEGGDVEQVYGVVPELLVSFIVYIYMVLFNSYW